MRILRAQYFFAYAIMGSVLPFVSVYFRQRGLSQVQVGYITAAASAAIVLSPILITLLADTRVDARLLMRGLFIVSFAGLVGTWFAAGFWMLLAMWLLYSLAYVPMMPLQDGINLNLQKRRESAGVSLIPYHRIRVWGTIGFMVPGAILFFVLWNTVDVSVSLIAAGICALLGAFNTLFLPDPAIRNAPDPAGALGDGGRLPTLAAARALLKPHVLIFCLATFLLNAATAAYYGFYPVYLKEVLHMDSRWLGPVQIFGGMFEVAFMLAYGWVIRRFGIRGLMVGGTISIVLRMALLGLVPNIWVAVGTQALHGWMVLALQVAPVVYLNEQAEDRFRHSMQGLYSMFGLGLARIVGSLLSGPIAKWSLTGLFLVSSGVCFAAMLLVAFTFREPEHPPAPAAPLRARTRA